MSYLDIGCADGNLSMHVAKTVNANVTVGVDVNSKDLQKARLNGMTTCLCNIDIDNLPFEDEEFCLVTAFDVIEHLLNPDKMLLEIKRVLRRDGFFLLSTPNMASWYNRMLLLIGEPILGIDMSNEYRYEYPLGVTSVISGHRRLYTIGVLEDLLKHYGFKIILSKSYAQIWSKTKPSKLLKLVYHLDKLLENRQPLAANLLVLVKKTA